MESHATEDVASPVCDLQLQIQLTRPVLGVNRSVVKWPPRRIMKSECDFRWNLRKNREV